MVGWGGDAVSGVELLLPLGLLALIGVPVVVLLHMRNTTPVARPVPTLRFWPAAEPERTERARLRRPPLSVLLLLQLLVVGLIAAGLTRPATARSLAGLDLRAAPQHLIVLLDGSTSMSAVDANAGSSRYEAGRARALEEVQDLREGDIATLVVLGTRTVTIEATDSGGFATLRDRLAALPQPGGRADLTAALTLTKDLLLPDLTDRVLLISDGALTADPGVVAALGAPVSEVRLGGTTGGDGGPTANAAVTDLSARATPGNPGRQQLYARIANFSPTPLTAPVVLTTDGIEAARRDVELPADGSAVELVWTLPAGVRDVEVVIETRDALPADDRASLILKQETNLALDILLVSDAPRALQRALEVLPGAQVTTEGTGSPTLASVGATYDLVVFEQATPPPTLPDAALLFVQPPAAGGAFTVIGQMPAPTVTSVAADDPLLEGVDLAGLTFAETPVYALTGDQEVVVGAETGPLLFRGTIDGRPSVTFAFDLNRSNIGQRVAFPILIANVAAELVPSPLPPAVPLGDPLAYRPSADAVAVRVVPPGAAAAVDLPLSLDGQPAAEDAASGNDGTDRLREVAFADTGRPGVYRVTELGPDGAELGGGRFVVNAGHPTESDLRPSADLADLLATARASDPPLVGADLADLWPLLVALAFGLLTLEWLVAVLPRRRRVPLPIRVR